MKKPMLAFLIIAFLAVVTILFYFFWLRPIDLTRSQQNTQQTSALTQPTITFVNPSRGSKEAKLTLIEFSDFECTHCQTIQDALSSALRAYPNELRLVWKDLPNPSVHPQSIVAAVAAHCADRQGKFWEYHDVLFARQTFLSDDQYKQIAQELNLDMDRFTLCLDSQDTLPIVQKDTEEGRALGIIATPTLFFGSQKIVGSIQPDELIQLIQTELTNQK